MSKENGRVKVEFSQDNGSCLGYFLALTRCENTQATHYLNKIQILQKGE
jgi:hypothetical protein